MVFFAVEATPNKPARGVKCVSAGVMKPLAILFSDYLKEVRLGQVPSVSDEKKSAPGDSSAMMETSLSVSESDQLDSIVKNSHQLKK